MKRKKWLGLAIVLVIAACLRLWRLNFPEQAYFDEIYHLPAVKMMAAGDFQTPFEWWHQADWPIYFDWLHPPLAKYIQAAFIKILPQLPALVAARLAAVVFALLSLAVFYSLVKTIFKNQRYALLATVWLASDGLFLVQSRIVMNDIFYLFFSLLVVLCYVRYLQNRQLSDLWLTGLILGLALASKWTAVWLCLFIVIKESWSLVKRQAGRQLPYLLFSLLLTPLMVYLLSFWPYFQSGKSLADWWQLQNQIWHFQWHLAASHPYQSMALTWPLNWRPVKYWQQASINEGLNSSIYAQLNPCFSLMVLIFPLLLVLPSTRRRLKDKLSANYYLFLSLFLVSFLPWQLVSRPLFLYHFLPAVPYLIIILSWPIYQVLQSLSSQQRQAWLFNLYFWPIVCALLYYPHWVGLAVPSDLATALYFYPTNWR